MVMLYGIRSCDSCRKARAWLDQAAIDYAWVDLRDDGVDRARLEAWRIALGDVALLNRRSKTLRDFSDEQKAAAETDPLSVLLEHPTLAKRPILEAGSQTLAGFSAARYQAALGDEAW